MKKLDDIMEEGLEEELREIQEEEVEKPDLLDSLKKHKGGKKAVKPEVRPQNQSEVPTADRQEEPEKTQRSEKTERSEKTQKPEKTQKADRTTDAPETAEALDVPETSAKTVRTAKTPTKGKAAGEELSKIFRTPWLIFAVIVLAIELLSGIMVSTMLIRTGMIPAKYLVILLLVFLVVFLLDFLLLYWMDYRGTGKKKGYIRRTFGTLVAAAVIICSIIGSAMLDKMMTTMSIVTAFHDVEHINICVYVMEDDPAETIIDAKDYTFGITEAYDYENTLSTISTMEESTGQTLKTEEYDDVFEMIDALRNGEVGAIILNQSYESIIEEVDGYSTFTYDTRILHYVTLEQEVAADEEEEKQIDVTKDPFIVYLSGSDTRSNILDISRSDVNILAVVNPQNHQILLVSTPRDYYVPISVGDGTQLDKLTHCGVYGTQCSIDTIDALYGIDIDFYAQINFTGFQTLIDAIGGVDVYSSKAFTYGEYSFTEGQNHLDGEHALAYARDRYDFAEGDNARGKHQMEVLKAVIWKIAGSTTLITNYSAIMDSLQGMFTTDVPSEDISKLVNMQLSDMSSSWEINSVAVTGSDSYSTETYSMPGQRLYVMIPNQDSIDEVIEKINHVLEK